MIKFCSYATACSEFPANCIRYALKNRDMHKLYNNCITADFLKSPDLTKEPDMTKLCQNLTTV